MNDWFKKKGPFLNIKSILRCSKMKPLLSNQGEEVSIMRNRKRPWFSSKKVAPAGCFSVYVGPEKEKFLVKTEHANHPLFWLLLQETESEYEYCSHGPLLMPCAVDRFLSILMAIEGGAGEG